MLANVLAIPDIACGRFDFKGTTDMAREVGAFVQDLGVAVPATSLRLHEGLDQIVAALRQRAGPTPLIFDTYEMAGETQQVGRKIAAAEPDSRDLVARRHRRTTGAGGKRAVWATVARPTVQLSCRSRPTGMTTAGCTARS